MKRCSVSHLGALQNAPTPSPWLAHLSDHLAQEGVTGPFGFLFQVFQFAVKESLILKLPTDELMNPSQKKKRKHRQGLDKGLSVPCALTSRWTPQRLPLECSIAQLKGQPSPCSSWVCASDQPFSPVPRCCGPGDKCLLSL